MFRILFLLTTLLVFSYSLPQIPLDGTKKSADSLTFLKNGKMQSRIMNGDLAKENAYPYQVAIFVGDGTEYCSGSLISETMVLTTTSCYHAFIDTSSILYFGYNNLMNSSSDQQQHKSSKNVYTHPDFNPSLLQNDIAIVELESKVTLNDMVKTITLDQGTNDHTNQVSVVTGWGKTDLHGQNEVNLRYIENPILSNDDCKKADSYYDSIIQKTHICLSNQGDKGICGFGDAGSPMVVEGIQVGIGAFAPVECSGLPSGFTRVSEFQSWIQEKCPDCKFGQSTIKF